MPIPPRGSFAILRAGNINLTTGDTEFFNVIENVSESGGALFLLKKRTLNMNNKASDFLVVSGAGHYSGYGSFQTGCHPMMHHDQSGRPFKDSYEVVRAFPALLVSLSTFHDLTGYKSIPFSVFK